MLHLRTMLGSRLQIFMGLTVNRARHAATHYRTCAFAVQQARCVSRWWVGQLNALFLTRTLRQKAGSEQTMRAAFIAMTLAVTAAPGSAAVAVNASASALAGLGASASAVLPVPMMPAVSSGATSDAAPSIVTFGAISASQSLRRLAGAMVGDLDGLPIKFSGLKLVGAERGFGDRVLAGSGGGASAPVLDAPLLPEIVLAASNPALIANHVAVSADAMPSGSAQMSVSDLGQLSLMNLAALPMLPSISERGTWGLLLLGFATLGVALRRTGHRSHISFS
jgi:hypothetical protein